MKKSIVYIYNSFNDPLFQGNFYQHLLIESKQNRFQFLLVTFEQEQFKLTKEEIILKKNELLQYNIQWYPLSWHTGNLLLVKKLYDLIVSFFLVLKLKIEQKPHSIISLGTISGAFAFILKRIFGFVHYAYQYEPHSLFMKDFGIWHMRNLPYKLLRFFENKIAQHAEIIATGTTYMVEELQKMRVRAEIVKLPSCINEEYFKIDRKAGQEIRKKYGIENEAKVIIYVGKFGGIYFDREIFNLFSVLNLHIKNLIVIVLSPDSQQDIINKMESHGLKKYIVKKAAYHEVYKYINAADIGLSGVPGLPAQKYRSPIKVGEYLLCGIPYITCLGVSEDDLIAENFDAGVVLQDFSEQSILDRIIEIKNKMTFKVPERLRDVGLKYRGLSNFKPLIDKIFTRIYHY